MNEPCLVKDSNEQESFVEKLKRAIVFICLGVAIFVLSSLSMGSGLEGVHELLVVNEYGTLFLVSIDGATVERIRHRPVGGVRGLSTRPSLLVHTRDDRGQFVFEEISLDGSLIETYARPIGSEYAISADGTKVLIHRPAAPSPHSIWFSDLSSGLEQNVINLPQGTNAFDLAWAPNNQMVAFSQRDQPRPGSHHWVQNIYLINLLDRIPILVTNSGRATQPAFSPDGRFLAYVEDNKGGLEHEWVLYNQDLSLLAQADSRIKVITRPDSAGGAWLGDLQWSPNGEWLFWAEVNDRGRFLGRERWPHLFKVRLDGTGLREIHFHRPWMFRLWHELWPPEGGDFDYQWWQVPKNKS